jgi:hypothetical protein
MKYTLIVYVFGSHPENFIHCVCYCSVIMLLQWNHPMNNDLYNEYIVRNGCRYRYDPDYDCYYRVYDRSDLTHAQQFGWIYVVAVLSAIAYYVEYLR